jgi:hypothetical protein
MISAAQSARQLKIKADQISYLKFQTREHGLNFANANNVIYRLNRELEFFTTSGIQRRAMTASTSEFPPDFYIATPCSGYFSKCLESDSRSASRSMQAIVARQIYRDQGHH